MMHPDLVPKQERGNENGAELQSGNETRLIALIIKTLSNNNRASIASKASAMIAS
jgi:hypothetical protein